MPFVRGAAGSSSCPSGRSRGRGTVVGDRCRRVRGSRDRAADRGRAVERAVIGRAAHRGHRSVRCDLDRAAFDRGGTRSRLPGRVRGLRARGRGPVRTLREGTRRPARPARVGHRSGCRPTCPGRFSSWSGARRSPVLSGTRSTSSSTRVSDGSRHRSARPSRVGGRASGSVPTSSCRYRSTPHRERQRGYDQAALIAAVAARHLGLPLARALERGRATVAQFELGRDQRAANVAGAFRARDRDPAAVRAVAGRWVLLVDDVVTTGATLAACADAARKDGRRRGLGDRRRARTVRSGRRSILEIGPSADPPALDPLARAPGWHRGGDA